MKHHMHMSTKELIEAFGRGPKGKRVVSSEMVRWLLSEPPRHLVEAAKILKDPVILKVDPECPPDKLYVMPSAHQIFSFEL